MKPEESSLLVELLAETDAVLTPVRRQLTDPSDAWAGVAERRSYFEERGVPFVAGGGEADRKADERTLRAMSRAGLIVLRGRHRRSSAKLTPLGDDLVRSLVDMPLAHESWPLLASIAEWSAKGTNAGCVNECQLLGIADYDELHGEGSRLNALEFQSLPLACRGLVVSDSDLYGRVGYGLTEAAREALKGKAPRKPKGLPKCDNAWADQYTDSYFAALEARATWEAQPNFVSVPLSAGLWPAYGRKTKTFRERFPATSV